MRELILGVYIGLLQRNFVAEPSGRLPVLTG
jgi:hypothetical protein